MSQTSALVHDRPQQQRRYVDMIAYGLVTYAAMNVGGILFLIDPSAEGLLSVPVLAASSLLIATTARRSMLQPAYLLFVLFMAAYLIGGIAPLVNGGPDNYLSSIVSYFGTLIFVSAMYFYVLSRGGQFVPSLMAVLQIIFLIGCIAALNTKVLPAVFTHAVPSDRATGFFLNPNETAVMALYYIVVLAVAPPSNRLWGLAQVLIAMMTLLAAFSKNGLLLCLVLLVVYLVCKRAYGRLLLAAGLFAVVLPSLDYIVSANILNLGIDQRQRVWQLVHLFSGQVDENLTTGRSQMWTLGLNQIAKTFPFGGGLGTFHHIEGGVRSPEGVWLGVHNAYLMVLGESGLAALLALLAFIAVAMRAAIRGPQPILCVGALIVLLGDMMATHGALSLRIHDLMLAIGMAVAATMTLIVKGDGLQPETGPVIRAANGQMRQPFKSRRINDRFSSPSL